MKPAVDATLLNISYSPSLLFLLCVGEAERRANTPPLLACNEQHMPPLGLAYPPNE